MRAAKYVLLGYLSGSVLYAKVFAKLFGKKDMIEKSKDKNPGTANAFMQGGFWCGMLTLLCDLLKGFLPVFLFCRFADRDAMNSVWMALVLAAPVLGHVFPAFYKMNGGKGIAVTFGSLMGLFPYWKPAVIQAAFFVFFSCIIRVTPHFSRTLVVYLSSLLCMMHVIDNPMIVLGFAIMTGVVYIRMLGSTEERQKMKVKLLWMH